MARSQKSGTYGGSEKLGDSPAARVSVKLRGSDWFEELSGL